MKKEEDSFFLLEFKSDHWFIESDTKDAYLQVVENIYSQTIQMDVSGLISA